MVASSGNKKIRNCQRSVICTIRPNFTRKLNSDSHSNVRISKVSELSGEATDE
ncbi:hypothetical protein D3C75_644270 [compost metagenome]